MSLDIATLGVQVDARQIQQGDRALDSFERTARRTDETTSRLNATQQRLADGMKQLAAAFAVAELIKYADTWNSLEGRLRLVTASTRELTDVTEQLFQMAQRTRGSLEGTVDLYTRLKRTTQDLSVTDADRLRVTEAINKANIISGASTQAMAASLLQLGQGFAANRLGGQELNSVLEETPRLAQAIAQGMGRTVGDLKKMGEEGKLTAEVVFNALLNQSQALDAEFSKMPKTVAQAFTTLENAALRAVGVMDQQNQLSHNVAEGVSFLADNINVLLAAVKGLGAATGARFLAGLAADLYASATASAAAAAATRAQAAASVTAAETALATAAANQAQAVATLAAIEGARADAVAQLQLSRANAAAASSALAAAEAAGAQSFALRVAREATLQLEAAELQRAAATAALATLGQQQARVSAQITAARTAETVATTELAAATAAAAGAGSIAARALGFLGGPIGIITTLLGLGVTAWQLWGSEASKAETKTEATLAEKHVDIMKALNDQIEKLKERNRLMGIAPNVAKGSNQFEQHAADILTEVNRVAHDANLTDVQRQEILKVLGGQYNEATIALEAYRKEQDKLQATQNGDKVQSWLAKHETYLSEAEKLANEIKDAKKDLGDAFTPDIQKRIEKSFADKAGKKAAAKYEEEVKKANEYIKTLQREVEQQGAARAAALDTSTTLADSAKLAEKQEYMLAAAQKAAEAPTMALRSKILQLALAQITEKQAADDAIESKKQYEEATKARTDASVAELAAGAQAVDQLQREVDTYGMGAAAVARYNLAKLQTREAILRANGGTDAEIAAVQALIKQQEKLVELSNLRDDMNALFDTTKVENFGDALRNAFGEAGNSLAQLTNALQDYVSKQDAAEKEKAKIRLKYRDDEERSAREIAKVEDRLDRDRIDSYATMAGAAKGFFKQNTAGYKLMEATERAFRAFEFAQAVMSLGVKLSTTETAVAAQVAGVTAATAATAASVAPTVAAEGVKQSAFGVTALASALSAPWPLSIPAYAAVAAMLASLGIAFRGHGGGMSLSASRQAQQGAGSVLGDSTAKSDSLNKALEKLKDNSNVALEYGSESLATLRSIDNGIAAFAARAASMAGLTGSTAGGSAGLAGTVGNLLSKTPLIGGLLGKVAGGVLGSIFGGGTSVQDTGFTIASGQLGALAGGGVQASQYQDMIKKGGWFSSDKHSTSLTSLGADSNADFSRILAGITRAVTLSAESLGLAGDGFKAKLDGFVVDIGKISLKDMKGDDIAKAIQAVFSKLGDDIAKYAAGGLEDFQHAGEGYLETLVRVANASERAQYELDRFGLKSVALADVQQKQGDVAAELVRQTLLAHESLASVADIMRTLDGTASELASTYEQLKNVQQQLTNVGIDPATLGRSLIGGARDLSGLSDALGTYFDKFFTDSEKAAAKTAELSDKFKALGFELPANNEAYRQLIESIPKTTAEGQALTGKLLLLAGAVSDLNAQTGKTTDALDLANKQRDLEVQILEATGRSAAATALKRQAELAAMDEGLRGLQSWLYALQDTKQAAEDAFGALQKAVNAEKKAREAAHNAQMAAFDTAIQAGKNSVSQLQQLAQTLAQSLNGMRLAGAAVSDRAEAQATIRRAMAGGMDSTRLQNALGTVGQDAGGQFTNRTDYLRDFYRTKIAVSELANQTDIQLTAAEKQVALLEQMKAQEQANYEASIAALDKQLDMAQKQLDALNGINTSVLTIPQALNNFAAALQAAQAAQAGALGAVGGAVGGVNAGTGTGFYTGAPGSLKPTPETKGWGSATSGFYDDPGQWKPGRVWNGIGWSVPGFASGGDHAGGWRMVGENGPELEYTGPSHIMSHGDTQDLLNAGPVVAAVDALREETRAALYAIAKNTMGTDKTLKRWDYNGQPDVRTA